MAAGDEDRTGGVMVAGVEDSNGMTDGRKSETHKDKHGDRALYTDIMELHMWLIIIIILIKSYIISQLYNKRIATH